MIPEFPIEWSIRNKSNCSKLWEGWMKPIYTSPHNNHSSGFKIYQRKDDWFRAKPTILKRLPMIVYSWPSNPIQELSTSIKGESKSEIGLLRERKESSGSLGETTWSWAYSKREMIKMIPVISIGYKFSTPKINTLPSLTPTAKLITFSQTGEILWLLVNSVKEKGL